MCWSHCSRGDGRNGLSPGADDISTSALEVSVVAIALSISGVSRLVLQLTVLHAVCDCAAAGSTTTAIATMAKHLAIPCRPCSCMNAVPLNMAGGGDKLIKRSCCGTASPCRRYPSIVVNRAGATRLSLNGARRWRKVAAGNAGMRTSKRRSTFLHVRPCLTRLSRYVKLRTPMCLAHFSGDGLLKCSVSSGPLDTRGYNRYAHRCHRYAASGIRSTG